MPKIPPHWQVFTGGVLALGLVAYMFVVATQ